MPRKKYEVAMEIAGNTAIWTRPDSGDSPVSYPAPTYSAVKGIFESVLWGPAVLVRPVRVELCAAPQYHSYITNYGGPLRNPTAIRKGNNYQMYATVLIDVCYRIYAEVEPNADKVCLNGQRRGTERQPLRVTPTRKYLTAGSDAGSPMEQFLWGGANLRPAMWAHFERKQRSAQSFRIF